MKTLHYPRLDAAHVFSRELLAKSTANLWSWRQGAGEFGQLHLHACWSESSALARRYHGQSIHRYHGLLAGIIALYRNSRDPRWLLLTHDIIGNVLYLQTDDGGFFHASGEFEPTYSCEESCPIHQGLPMLGLLNYAEWPEADPVRVAQIHLAFERWWRWIERHWWKRGNAWKKPLEEPGFCGVTNQDLVIVACLAKQAQTNGDWTRYDQFGSPVLDACLSPACYHSETGLFERGDRSNFAERSSYYGIIVPMLKIIHTLTRDGRLPPVIDNVVNGLFRATYVGPDGLRHIAWGATTDLANKDKILGWERLPCTFSAYPELIEIMGDHVRRHSSIEHRSIVCDLEKTLAAYVFDDGTIPVALGGDSLFSAIGHAQSLWTFLINRLGKNACLTADIPPLNSLQRTCGDVVFRENARHWSVSDRGLQKFAGVKCNPSAIAIGPEESLPGMNSDSLCEPGLLEIVNPFCQIHSVI